MDNQPYELYLRPSELRHGKAATLTISNLSDSDQTFQVLLNGAESFNLEVAPQIAIGAGEQALVPIKISAENRKLFGYKDEQTLQLRVSDGNNASQTISAPISIPARIPVWVAPLVGLIAILTTGFVVVQQASLLATATPTPTPSPTPLVVEADCAGNAMEVFRPNSLTPITSGTFIDTTAPPQAIQSLQFLEMPFPIDGSNTNFGGTDAQFRQASRAYRYGGRIYSYFDHFYPLYPAPSAGAVTQGREPAQAPVGGNMLLYDGSLVPTGYSGHPAYDFSPSAPQAGITPLFAAADGVVESVGIHAASGAYFVRILHTIPNEGNYLTIYWHLHPDQFYEAMRPRVGQTIRAGERVGTIGNTGWSTGPHLHFEVRLDGNNDGVFSTFEKVDPYGFVPSADYPQDPWATSFNITDAQGRSYTHTPLVSRYLWKHPLGFSAQIPDNGGGTLPSTVSGGAGMGGCAPANTFPPGGVINFAWVPDPSPTNELAGTGQACALSVFDAAGEPITQFGQPLRIEIPFSFDNLKDVDAATMAVYWKAAGSDSFAPLDTDIQFDDAGGGIAVAYTQEAGHCALMGQPSRDFLPPESQILVEGASSDGGTSWYDSVVVSLVSSAEDLAQINYSLDGGESWQPYTEPFELAVAGIPDLQNGVPEEGFQTGEGRYLVLSAAVGQTGNVEAPPQSR
ncbi:MAG TPA: hypothetical protein ENJ56_02660, partial [Anaerolineae bacterium]|nr:hypothetical protein [Anaerolineae bacterium]